jgi:Lon protease-like protein
MTDAFNRVRGLRELPLFPLPVVLFPGTPLPLHIFEPRYRQMLIDVRVRDNLFGLSYFDASQSDRDIPPIGHVGCAAEVAEVQPLPDGRSNILTVGLIRYHVEAYVERGDPYLVGRVAFFEDEVEDERKLAERAREVTTLFERIARSVRTLNDERVQLPDLSETDPERLSFMVAAAIDLEADVKLELLEMRSTSQRLERIGELLARVVDNYEERARMHQLARHNGHSPKRLKLE